MMWKKINIYFCILVIALFLISSFSTYIAVENEVDPFTNSNNATFGIWDCEIILNKPDKAMVITLEQKQWQAMVAVCAIPAFIGRGDKTPLMFAEKAQDISTVVPYDTKAVTTWGSDAKSASAKLATDYWSKADIVFAVESYEETLWIVSTAAFIGAPILVSPSESIL